MTPWRKETEPILENMWEETPHRLLGEGFSDEWVCQEGLGDPVNRYTNEACPRRLVEV